MNGHGELMDSMKSRIARSWLHDIEYSASDAEFKNLKMKNMYHDQKLTLLHNVHYYITLFVDKLSLSIAAHSMNWSTSDIC